MLVKIVPKKWNKTLFGTSTLMKAGLFVLFSGVLAACSAPRELVGSDKHELIQRVTARWQCLERNDYGCAYQYSSPTYRAVFTQKMYERRFVSMLERRLTGVKLVAYDRNAAVASVDVGVMSRPSKYTTSASRALGALPSTISEKWIWLDGEWWYIDQP